MLSVRNHYSCTTRLESLCNVSHESNEYDEANRFGLSQKIVCM